MGLDMYLYKRTYVQNWDHMEDEAKHSITIEGPEASHIDTKRITNIEEQVGYWRKANSIHKWFVDNVQNGVDECQESVVSKEQLQKLLYICKTLQEEMVLQKGIIENGQVLQEAKFTPKYELGDMVVNEELCKELLPTTEGFFFGSTNYDQWYFDDIKHTVEVLTEALQNTDSSGVSYYYQASW